MKNLTAVGTTFPLQRSPENGDAGSGPTFETPFQDAANRAQFLYNALTPDGIAKVRQVGDTDALKALASPAEGQIVTVGGDQLYTYRPGTAPTVGDIPAILYKGTTLAGGYWVSPLWYLSTGEGATLRMDSNVLTVKNRLLLEQLDTAGGDNAIDSGTGWKDIVVATTVSLAIGDVVHLSYASTVKTGDTSYEVQGRLAVTKPDATVSALMGSGLTLDFTVSNKRQSLALQSRYVATAAGNHTFRGQCNLVTGGGPYTVTFGNPTLRTLAFRP